MSDSRMFAVMWGFSIVACGVEIALAMTADETLTRAICMGGAATTALASFGILAAALLASPSATHGDREVGG